MKSYKLKVLILVSILAPFVASIGGIISPYFYFVTMGLGYLALIYYLIKNENNKRSILIKGLIITGGYLIYFTGLHLFENDLTLFLLNIPLVIIPFIAIYFAYIISIARPLKKVRITISFIAGVFLFAFLIFPNLQNWLMFPNAREIRTLPAVILETKDGKQIPTTGFIEKTTVIDFWSTSCGICYKKFPDFESLHNFYKADTNIVFYSIHIPTKYDTLENSKELLDEFNYSFNQLFSLDPDDMEAFDIPFFPVLMVVNKDLEIIYKGGLNIKWYEVVYNARRIINMETETY